MFKDKIILIVGGIPTIKRISNEFRYCLGVEGAVRRTLTPI